MIIGSNAVRLIGSSVKHMGRVEVFDRTLNQWGTICTNDIIDPLSLGQIICKSLGYYDYDAVGNATSSSNIAPSSNSPILAGPISCTYTPSYAYQNLYLCPDFGSHLGMPSSQCIPDEEFVVACMRKFPIIMYNYSLYQDN